MDEEQEDQEINTLHSLFFEPDKLCESKHFQVPTSLWTGFIDRYRSHLASLGRVLYQDQQSIHDGLNRLEEYTLRMANTLHQRQDSLHKQAQSCHELTDLTHAIDQTITGYTRLFQQLDHLNRILPAAEQLDNLTEYPTLQKLKSMLT